MTTILPQQTPTGSPVPTRGDTVIADSVVGKVAGLAAREVPGVYALGGGATRVLGAIREAVGGTDHAQGITADITDGQVSVSVSLVADYPVPLPVVADTVRSTVIAAIETIVGLSVTDVNVTITDVHTPVDETVPQPPPKEKERISMSASDKFENAAQDLKGKAKEAVGNVTNDDSKVAEGKADQAAASAKKAGENVKDAFKK